MPGVVLVTGAGRGIGAAIARLAGRRGYKVAVNYAKSADAAKAVVADIERGGGTAIAIRADVSVEAQVAEMFRNIDRALGPVTALVNNAGILGKPTPVANLSAAALADLLRVNVGGAFLCAREAIARMSTQSGGKGGAIVNIGSMAAPLGGLPHCVAYAASKGATDSFTIGLARELAPAGIRVNCVRPGLVETDILDDGIGVEAVKTMVKTAVPLGRVGQPGEIANMVLWLLSEEASYVTGAIYNVSGGR
jgi:NAD(P)-dependent dehydrogenase (short-subunit alcohol dehydrogenase family)